MSENVLTATFQLSRKSTEKVTAVIEQCNASIQAKDVRVTKKGSEYSVGLAFVEYVEDYFLTLNTALVAFGAKNIVFRFYFEQAHEEAFLCYLNGQLKSFSALDALQAEVKQSQQNTEGVKLFDLPRNGSGNYALCRFHLPKEKDREFLYSLFNNMQGLTPEESRALFVASTQKKFRKWNGQTVRWCEWVRVDGDTERVYEGFNNVVDVVVSVKVIGEFLYVAFDVTAMASLQGINDWEAKLSDTSVPLGMLRGVKSVFVKYRCKLFDVKEVNVAGEYGGVDYHNKFSPDDLWQRTYTW